MLKFLLGAAVVLWVVTGENPVARAFVVGCIAGTWYLVRWARR
jgi:hypothetical protein